MRDGNGRWIKGYSGNPKGKPEGAVSEKVSVWNEVSDHFTSGLLDQYMANLQDMMDNDDPLIREKAMYRYESLLEYFKPKLSRTELDANVKQESNFDPSQYTDDELAQLERLLEKGKG